jgi:hypothetical protein
VRSIAATLALVCAGCIALGRESYTTLAGDGATPISPSADVPVKSDRVGHGFAQDASGARANADIVVSVCDWDPGFWLFVFPPIPLPLISNEEQPGLPDTLLVRVTFEGAGPWRAKFADLALVGTDATRVTPLRYRIVLAAKAESLAESDTHVRELEPCSRALEPQKSVDRAHVAVLERGELWLMFDTRKLPEGGSRVLQLDGISHGDAPVTLPHLALDDGSRWFWYRVFP